MANQPPRGLLRWQPCQIEFSRLPAMFGLIKKFDRAAVLTDKTWLKKVSEFEGLSLCVNEGKTPTPCTTSQKRMLCNLTNFKFRSDGEDFRHFKCRNFRI
jgi:hypothetical protein